jgi:transcriptional regulator with XRE-family HTH domain
VPGTWGREMAKARREALTRRRRACGISQEELAAKLRVDPRTVGRWEAGTAEPTPWLRPGLAYALGLTLDELDYVLLLPGDDAGPSQPGFNDAVGVAELNAQATVATWMGRRPAEPSAAADPVGRFLGDGHIVIATPVKREQIKSRPVIAVEDVLGSRRLGQAAEEHGLKVSYETIPPDGAFDVERPNIVAICGPRISAAIGAVLATDPVLAFVRSNRGHWTLFDKATGQTHTSGIDLDQPEPFDIAYLGRLRRPGGQGTIMILTGIHPQGSLGVINMICSGISGLYDAVGDRRFSVLLRSEYDPDTSEPINVERLTPFYQEHMVVD